MSILDRIKQLYGGLRSAKPEPTNILVMPQENTPQDASPIKINPDIVVGNFAHYSLQKDPEYEKLSLSFNAPPRPRSDLQFNTRPLVEYPDGIHFTLQGPPSTEVVYEVPTQPPIDVLYEIPKMPSSLDELYVVPDAKVLSLTDRLKSK